MGAPKCIAYLNDNTTCGLPALFFDEQRGGMVCATHAPLNAISAVDVLYALRDGLDPDDAPTRETLEQLLAAIRHKP